MEEQMQKVSAIREKSHYPGTALLFGAMKPATRAEIMSSFPSKYTTDILIARFFNSRDPTACKQLPGLCALSMIIQLTVSRPPPWSIFPDPGKLAIFKRILLFLC